MEEKSNLQEIEQAVSLLSEKDLAKFRIWFAEFDAAEWDRQFEEDVAANRLEYLAERALRDLREENYTDL